jgi:hypothetical protein
MKVACLMMQKDEPSLLGAWLTYHGNLFGFANLFVFDNGSVNPAVATILQRYGALGVHIDRDHNAREDFLNKGSVLGDQIRQLDADGGHDLYLLLDCDEFVVKRTEWGFTTDREAILAYLATLVTGERVLRVPYQLANHPVLPDLYSLFGFHKVFFRRGTFASTDRGFHIGTSRTGAGYEDTALVHLHFHHRPFPTLLELARRKWGGSVPYTDLKALETYKGHSMHLAKYFLMDDAAYLGSFADKPHFYIPAFRSLVLRLGAAMALEGATDPSDRDAGDNPFGTMPPPFGDLPDQGENERTMVLVPRGFNEAAYLQANKDVAKAISHAQGQAQLNAAALRHFSNYGVREGRPLGPTAHATAAPAVPATQQKPG